MYEMVKRTETTKQIVVSLPVHERFMAYREFNENKEGILIKLMTMADKYLAMTNRLRKPRGES